MSLLSRAFGGGEKRTLTGVSWPIWALDGHIPTPLEDAALQSGAVADGGAMSLGAFYACVTLLADIVSSLPLRAYKLKDGAQVPVDPQPLLFQNGPYPGMTWFAWLWMLMESLTVTGNGFGYTTARGADDRPTGIMPIHPSQINVQLPQSEGTAWPDPIYSIDGEQVSSSDIIHIRRYPIAGAAMGMSPVQKAAAAVGLGLSAERYGLRYFRDSANPSGLLSTEQDLTPDQARQAQKRWLQSHQGRRLPAVMSGGLKWQSVTLTPDESQFIETRSHQVSEIARWFRIPPHMIGETAKSTSWGSGLEQQVLGFTKFTLVPWLSCIEQEFTALLPRGQFARFDLIELERADYETRLRAYNHGRNSGLYSVNDLCDLEGRPQIGADGDIRLQPMNYVPLGTPVDEYLGKGEPTDTPAGPDTQPGNGQGGN